MRIRMHIVGVLALLLGSGACVGTDVGNPGDEEAEVEMHLDGYDSSSDEQALKLPENTKLESAWVVTDEFQFQEADACGDNDEPDRTEPLVVDLLAEEPSYEPPLLTTPAGEYCRLDVGLAAEGSSELPDDAPEALDGHGLVIEGQRADQVDFRIEIALEEDVTLEGLDEGFELVEDRQSLIVGFAINDWLDESELNGLGQPDGDVLVIDETSHPDFVDDVSQAIPDSAGLFEDTNENGQLEEEERGNAVARGAIDSSEGRDNVDAGNGDGGR
ncbi:MAG: hypothetical protein ACOCV2_11565 [Persicimonas sp.]